MRTTRIAAAIAAVGLAVGACGGDDGPSLDGADPDLFGQSADDELDEFTDAVNNATGAGGGGTLTFDGTERPIDAATCLNTPERVDIGTVGPDFYRVFVSGNPADLDLQVLTPEGVQWFDGTPMQENKPTITIDGNTVSATGGVFFNNQDDTLITIEFVIECPDDIL